MSFSDFKKETKQKLEDYRPEIDAEAFWTELEPHIKKDKKKRRFLWILLFFATMAGGAGLWYQWHKPAPITAKAPTNIATQENLNETQKTFNKKQVDISNAEQALTLAKEKQTNLNPINSRSLTSDQFQESSAQTAPTKNIIPDSPFHSSDASASEEYFSTEHPEVQKTKKITTATKSETEIEKASTVNWTAFNQIPSLPFEDLRTKLASIPLPGSLEEGMPEKETILALQKKKTFIRAIGLKAGWGRLDQSLKINPETEIESSDPYLADRLRTETALEEVYAGLEISLLHKKGLYLKSGLDYSRIASRFDLESTEVEEEIIEEGILRIYTNSLTEDSTFIYGPVVRYHRTTSKKQRFNNVTTLAIPLTLGYRFDHEAWSFGVEAGVLLNIRRQTKATILAWRAEEKIYDGTTDPLLWYDNSFGLRARVGLDVAYKFHPHWQIFAAPEYRFPALYSSEANVVNQKFSSLGIGTGLRFCF